MTGSESSSRVETWAQLGERHRLLGREIFVVDVGPDAVDADPDLPALLVLHGFPTSSIDFAEVLASFRMDRRVVLFDFVGFGLSEKPDQRYSLFDQADLVEAVAAHRGLDRVDLLTHDMGDSVGGEILARSLDEHLGFEIARRVLTNGSVYIDRAQLTDGQQMLLSLPDERLPDGGAGFDVAAVSDALRATLGAGGPATEEHLVAAAELVVRDGGAALLPRTIRYVEERRVHEERWTGAIERHPSPLTIVWGPEDPIAVVAMVEELTRRRPDADLALLEGVGHYPMIEAPEKFAGAVRTGLSSG